MEERQTSSELSRLKEFIGYTDYIQRIAKRIKDTNKLDTDIVYELQYAKKYLHGISSDNLVGMGVQGVADKVTDVIDMYLDTVDYKSLEYVEERCSKDKILDSKPFSMDKYYIIKKKYGDDTINKDRRDMMYERLGIIVWYILCIITAATSDKLALVFLVCSACYIAVRALKYMVTAIKHINTLDIVGYDRIRRNLLWLKYMEDNIADIVFSTGKDEMKLKLTDIVYKLGDIDRNRLKEDINKEIMDAMVDIEYLWDDFILNSRISKVIVEDKG